jgi:hypothetical protein
MTLVYESLAQVLELSPSITGRQEAEALHIASYLTWEVHGRTSFEFYGPIEPCLVEGDVIATSNLFELASGGFLVCDPESWLTALGFPGVLEVVVDGWSRAREDKPVVHA